MFAKSWHEQFGATFIDLNGQTAPSDYGDSSTEYRFLQESAGLLDLSFRSRLVVLGSDRQRFLNGQVTNDIKKLLPGQGCYAALTNAKAKMVSDLYVYIFADEILLDFEPGLTQTVTERLEKYIVADDVQLTDAAPHFGLLSVQGPKAGEAIASLNVPLPEQPMTHLSCNHVSFGELYVMNQPRLGSRGFDIYAPVDAIPALARELLASVSWLRGGLTGWRAFEVARIEMGIPRFGIDMDESNLAPETGLAGTAIRYDKGCYIGQEIIARIRTYGQVSKSLRGLRLSDHLQQLPAKGDKLFQVGKEMGYITSATYSPKLRQNIALGYLRREANQIGSSLSLRIAGADSEVTIIELPFNK